MDNPQQRTIPSDEAGKMSTAVFAGGCFWCVEADFQKIDGVQQAISGYTGGRTENPSYQQVSRGGSGHLEAVQVHFDPCKVSYQELLSHFWRMVDPTDGGGQFVDRGEQYRTAIYYADDEQRLQAEASKKALDEAKILPRPVATAILPLQVFYPAEEYHQDYAKKNSSHYQRYRSGSGRDQFIARMCTLLPAQTPAATPSPRYARPDDAELRQRLTPLQYKVARENGTEPPFRNDYWNNHAAGIYVDIVSGEPLFSSTDKFDSGTGWPSFTKPLAPDKVVEKSDRSLFMARTEVRSALADSHLGHVFNDGPKPSGMRYCINSAALRFIPAEALEGEGLGQFLPLFKKTETK